MSEAKQFAIAGSIAIAVFLVMGLLGVGPQLTGYSVLDENLTITINNPEQGSSINYTDVTVSVTTNKEADCELNSELMFTTGSTLHLEPLSDLSVGEHQYSVDCMTNETSAQVNLVFTIEENEVVNETVEINETVNETVDINETVDVNETINETVNETVDETENIVQQIPITVTKTSPTQSTLREKSAWINVTTNINATCKYDGVQFANTGSVKHSQKLSSLVEDVTYSYDVECLDNGNSSNKKRVTVGFKIDTEYCGDNVCQSSETANGCRTDCDSDEDGIKDTEDKLIGSVDDVDVSYIDDFVIKIDGSTNLKKSFSGDREIKFYSDDELIVEFDYDFDEALDLNSITIKKQSTSKDYGYILINGLDIGNEEKTVYVDSVADSDKLCVLDENVTSLSDLTDECDGEDEVLLKCPETRSGITCAKDGDRYEIVGLDHSLVKEMEKNESEKAEDEIEENCAKYWVCTAWNPSNCPPEGRQTRSCTNTKGCGDGKPTLMQTCTYQPSCEDGIRNQGEIQTDCGGPCKACSTTFQRRQPIPVATTATGQAAAETQSAKNIDDEEGGSIFLWLIILVILGIGGAGTYIYVKPQLKNLHLMKKEETGGEYSLEDVKEALLLLEEPIHTALIQGNSEQDIKNSLVEQGWDLDLVEEILKVYQFEEHHKQLYEYMKKQIAKGKDIAEVRRNLIEKKWDKKLVDEMIKVAK